MWSFLFHFLSNLRLYIPYILFFSPAVLKLAAEVNPLLKDLKLLFSLRSDRPSLTCPPAPPFVGIVYTVGSTQIQRNVPKKLIIFTQTKQGNNCGSLRIIGRTFDFYFFFFSNLTFSINNLL